MDKWHRTKAGATRMRSDAFGFVEASVNEAHATHILHANVAFLATVFTTGGLFERYDFNRSGIVDGKIQRGARLIGCWGNGREG